MRVEEVDSFPKEGIVSAIGHADTAKVLGLPCNRVTLKLTLGDILYVAQLQGGRLPEGTTTLPEGFYFKFYRISFLPGNYEEIIESGMPY